MGKERKTEETFQKKFAKVLEADSLRGSSPTNYAAISEREGEYSIKS